MMKKTIYALLFLFAGWQTVQAQDLSKLLVLSDSAYQGMKAYKSGNKYQRDAILFMDMVADTHPYFVESKRRAEWFKKKKGVLKQCKTIQTDEELVDILNNALGPLHDKHSDLTTIKRRQELIMEARKKLKPEELTGAIDREHIMRPHSSFYDYQIYQDESICYLQFNKCTNAQDYPFYRFLDDMFAKMEEAGIKTLVVDAQYNSGGSSQLCDQLLVHLYPLEKMKLFSTYLRFSDLAATQDSRITEAKKNWEKDGHKGELYKMPDFKIPATFQQPRIFDGQVVFVMGEQTFSSSGMLMTLARDNHIGTIIGTTSTFSPSHYGNIVSYRLPNTGALGSISTRYFVRPDAATTEDKCLEPDTKINLDDKDASWQYVIKTYGK